MIRAALLISLALLPDLAFSQEVDRITKIVRVRYADADRIGGLVRAGSRATIQADNSLQAIVISGRPTDVVSAEQAIHELDTPSAAPKSVAVDKDIDFLVYVVGASKKSNTQATASVPEAIAPVVKQLRPIFPYKSYELLGTIMMRSSEDRPGNNEGLLKEVADASAPSAYSVHYDRANISLKGKRPSIHVSNFRFDLTSEFTTQSPSNGTSLVTSASLRNLRVGIQSDVDLQEGQKVVVGKTNVESGDSGLFIVLSTKLVDYY